MRKAVRIVVTGRVQGVWYRGWTVEQAAGRGLDGWVRNRSDGSVEAVVAGDPAEVDALVEACRSGPPAARVMDVVAEPADDPGPGGFAQLPTA
ncbi:acylphosphatase [Arenibaculum pallidiluteum]|uniref:acylphosphatase n=1 Tax=Arenibaculum pallidiluteum TaxID=2812559 RepID=UPI001A974373|nr:acylphosphatase [Arenibaculum pallidiluteum]